MVLEDDIIKKITNLFGIRKKKKVIRDEEIRGIIIPFELENEG